MNKKRVNILWTGGWDSTYRIVELSRQDVIVQPIYIVGDGRISEEREKSAIQKITQMLQNKKETKAKILPLQLITKQEIPENEKITQAYKIINQETNLGSQHEWLARYAYIHPGLELGTENAEPETSHIIDAIQRYGKLIKKEDTYIWDKKNSTEIGTLVLGNFEYPIIDKYETDMLENIHKWGYEDIMSEIWFCHSPINGKPCGFCHPCAVKMESKMEFLLPQDAQKRYKIKKHLNNVIGQRYTDKICYMIRKRITKR